MKLPIPPLPEINYSAAIIENWRDIENWAVSNDPIWHRIFKLTPYWRTEDRLRFLCAAMLQQRYADLNTLIAVSAAAPSPALQSQFLPPQT